MRKNSKNNGWGWRVIKQKQKILQDRMLLRAHSHLRKEWLNVIRYVAQTLGVKEVLKKYGSVVCLFFRAVRGKLKGRKEHSRLDMSLRVWLPEHVYLAMFASYKLGKKGEIIWYSITIFNLSQNSIKINKIKATIYPHHIFITKSALIF